MLISVFRSFDKLFVTLAMSQFCTGVMLTEKERVDKKMSPNHAARRLNTFSRSRNAAINRRENNIDLSLTACANNQIVVTSRIKAKTGWRNIFQIFFSGLELRL